MDGVLIFDDTTPVEFTDENPDVLTIIVDTTTSTEVEQPGSVVVINDEPSGDAVDELTGGSLLVVTTASGMKGDPGGSGGANSLDELSDVILTNPTTGHILKHDGTAFVNTPIPPAGVSSVDGRTGAVTLGDLYETPTGAQAKVDTASTADRNRANHTGTQPASTVTGLAAVATSGSAADLTGVLGTSQLPPLAINDVFPVASEVEMLALNAQRGDIAIRTDLSNTYILATDSPGTLADWKEITASGDVLSVAGKTGAVVLSKADVGLPNVDDTADVDKPVSTAQQAALDGKADDGHGHAAVEVTVTPTGNIAATDVQAAITELENDKRRRNSPIIETPFLSFDSLYKTSTDNALWKADRRWTVTHKAYRKSDNVYLRDLSTVVAFEDSYDSRTIIAATEYQILEVDFGGTWPGYSYGPFYINFYAGRGPDNVIVDVYTDYAPHGGPGWINLNAVVEENWGSNLLWRATSGVFQITKLRIRVDGNTSGTNTNNETSLCRVEWHLTRPQAYNSKVFIDKYGSHTDLLYDFAWKDTNGVESARIGPGGITKHPKLTWIAIPLVNGWANHSTGHRDAAYAIDPFGVVHLRGLFNSTAATSTSIGNLPVGYRPGVSEIFNQRSSANTTTTDVRVNPSGLINHVGVKPDAWLSLAGITFQADQ